MTAVRTLNSLILTRHGESTGNVAYHAVWDDDAVEEVDVPERDADIPLSARGRGQAAALGRRLAELPPHERPTAVFASPYVRTLDTTRIVLMEMGEELGVHVDERLRDREVGVFDRLTPKGVRARFPDEAERKERIGKFYYRPPGGESWADVALRLRSVYNDIDLDHPGERVMVVAHDAIVVITRYIVERLSEHEVMEIEKTPVGNCSVSRWQRTQGALRAVDYNDVAHLVGLTEAEARAS